MPYHLLQELRLLGQNGLNGGHMIAISLHRQLAYSHNPTGFFLCQTRQHCAESNRTSQRRNQFTMHDDRLSAPVILRSRELLQPSCHASYPEHWPSKRSDTDVDVK